jgi:hypothetical protein
MFRQKLVKIVQREEEREGHLSKAKSQIKGRRDLRYKGNRF